MSFMEFLIALYFEAKHQKHCEEWEEPNLPRQYPGSAPVYFEGPGGLDALSVVERELVRRALEQQREAWAWATGDRR